MGSPPYVVLLLSERSQQRDQVYSWSLHFLSDFFPFLLSSLGPRDDYLVVVFIYER